MTQVPEAFVIGDPVAHSKSPRIHARWLAEFGIAGRYSAIHVKPEALAAFIVEVRDGAHVGGNVTIPHKIAVMGLCDDLEDAARAIGAVNTLVRQPGGTLLGRNTDHYGFVANLDAEHPGWDGNRGRAMILGAGGAARAIVYALRARGFAEIIVLNRTADKAESLAADFGARAAGMAEFAALAGETDCLVNTSSIGMDGTRFVGLDLAALPGHCVVTDIVYTPLTTPLLADARQRGLVTVDGLGMLLHQAVPGFAAWFGKTPAVTAALRAEIIAAMGE